MINYKEFTGKSVAFLIKYAKENHLQSYVIGISGGIDSTISACIASKACEKLNIPLIGRSLPTSTNKSEEIEVANLVGRAFCNNFKTINIFDECETIITALESTEGKLTNLQKGNVKARYRMIYLRNLASIHRGVVLDNDNFTEYNTGFWTIAGDSPMDVNCGIHYLWKTEIYELASYLANEEYGGIQNDAIIASMNLTPTDGNGVSNSDCEQFGLDNYEQVDDVLKTMYYTTYLDKHMDIDQESKDKEYLRLIDSYNKQGVDKVMLLHQNTKYKRKELPIKPTKEELGL